jgi:hypothetical protein
MIVPLKQLLSPNSARHKDITDGRPHAAKLKVLIKFFFLEFPGPSGVAQGGAQTVPSLWVDMPGQTGVAGIMT